MENFPGNSHRAQEDEEQDAKQSKRVETVVDTGAVRRKKPLGKRFSEMFFGDDVESVVNYVVMDVLIPAAKDALADALSKGVERMLFGDARNGNYRRTTRSRTIPTTTHVNYRGYSQPNVPVRGEEPRNTLSRRARAQHDLDEILIPSRAAAEEVLYRMANAIERYEQVTLADLYSMVNIAPKFTDENWGWTDIRDIQESNVRRTRSGYLLDLPRPVPVD